MRSETKEEEETSEKNNEKTKQAPIKKTSDFMRLKLEKLMKNIDKPVIIPERPKQKSAPSVPEFVRNVMGSSAGAGSGEFHVYRHLRRKEYARQKFIQIKSELEQKDEEYHKKLEENTKAAQEATAKKRAKRLKRKEKKKIKRVEGAPKDKVRDATQEEENESDSEEEQTQENAYITRN